MHRRKMIAPIIVTILVVLYYMAYFGWIIYMIDRAWAIVLGVVPLALSIAMIAVCVQRIREIRKGEEDDLSKY